ncbi:acetyltransferase (GNAT) family protein [Planomicrobium soli]|uniref:Acetyltransferase (GNAT) family protein n=1 Tax=Planomicrobium soli TaxID=1176648 RepID=A0A2P8H538_9BACL|nr:GNAT family N-acetyltransferase [Planomicrobium soli]PSL41331.1 acetyltransferase (GNAT) family protein [Planomicrobium soli]
MYNEFKKEAIPLLIRKVESTEYETVRQQRLTSYEQYKNRIPLKHWEVLQGTLSKQSDKHPGVNLFVAEIGGQIAGSVVLFPSKAKAYEWDSETLEHPEIRMLAVDANYRGLGVGKALVQHCIKVSKELGENQIGLHTGSFMEGAKKLYENLGFKRMPLSDFEPLDDGIVVQAYQLTI